MAKGSIFQSVVIGVCVALVTTGALSAIEKFGDYIGNQIPNKNMIQSEELSSGSDVMENSTSMESIDGESN